MPKTIKLKLSFINTIILIGIVILIASVFYWFKAIYSSPSNVFDRMLTNSLASTSVAKIITQSGGSQSLEEKSLLVTQPEQRVHSRSILGQGANSDTQIKTESIASPLYDFVRYTDISTTQKSTSGAGFNFSSVLGIWGKSDKASSTGSGAQLYDQTVLGVVPIANLPKSQKANLIKQIKKDVVYKYDSSNTKRQILNGRPVYSYGVEVAPVAYVSMLKSFAKDIGINQLEQIDPAQYANSAPLKFTFDIDVWSGQLTKISYENSVRVENFAAYGDKSQIKLPTSSIDVNALQARLRQIQ